MDLKSVLYRETFANETFEKPLKESGLRVAMGRLSARHHRLLLVAVLAAIHTWTFAAPGGKVVRRAEGKDEKDTRGYQFGDLFLNKITGKESYEFGDLSRFIGGKVQEAVGNFTGKESYEFGDISKTLDAKAKAEVCKVTGKDVYKLGDISKFLDGQAKAQVAGLIGKETYEFGDISREIARRAKEVDVDEEDLLLLLKAVITMGVGLTPVAHLLPMQVLLNLYGSSVELELGQRVSARLTAALAKELDRRSKEALLGKGNEDYVLGDLTRKQLQQSLRSITGKDNYEFGDISRSLLRRLQQGS